MLASLAKWVRSERMEGIFKDSKCLDTEIRDKQGRF